MSFSESGYEGGPVGDEDEGFDEEFCDPEEVAQPMRSTPQTAATTTAAAATNITYPLLPLNLKELNSDDLQSLLVENSFADEGSGEDLTPPTFPAPSLLDDIDPGVYMTDMEPSSHSFFTDERKSPVHSPFPLSSPSPVCVTMSLGGGGVGGESPVSEWSGSAGIHYPPAAYSDSSSSVAGDSEYSSSVDLVSSSQYLFPVSSLPSPSPPPTTLGGQHFNLDRLSTLPSNYHHQHFPQSSSSSTVQPNLYQHQHQVPPSSFPHHSTSSNLNLVNCYGDGGSPMHSSLPPSPTPSPHHSNPSPNAYQTPQSTYEATPLINGQYNTMHSPVHQQTTPTLNFSSCSTQTPLATRTPSPVPSSTSHTHNLEDEPKRKPSTTAKKPDGLVHMPYYRFKKILDSPTVTEEDKSDIKNVRRRGKNKIAAKNCRQRKQELVLGLQEEIERLRSERDGVFLETRTIEKEIAQLKSHCLALFHRNKLQQQQQQQQAVH